MSSTVDTHHTNSQRTIETTSETKVTQVENNTQKEQVKPAKNDAPQLKDGSTNAVNNSLVEDDKEDSSPTKFVEQEEVKQNVVNDTSEQPTKIESQLIEASTNIELSRFNQLLSSEQVNTSRIQAFRNLSDIWETPLPIVMIDDFCTEVRKLKLDCYAGENGSLQEIALFDRPTILVLENQTGIHRVILRGINETEANVQIGDNQVTVSRSELEQLWNGNYLLYWQPPAVGLSLIHI